MLRSDGVDLPTPSSYAVDYEELSRAERNALGTMVKDVIAYKYKLNCVWKSLTQTEMAKLMAVKKKNTFSLDFIGLETGERITGHFYAGTPSASAMEYKNGRVDRWLDVKMNFIEM